MTRVLNPRLFAALCRRFGEVRIVNPGAPVVWQLVRLRPGGPLVRKFFSDGEVYKVNCPICGDRRWRLRFGHRFGMWDAEVRSYHWERVFCFNESCFASFEARQRLVWQLFHHAPPKHERVPQAAPVMEELPAVEWPGEMIRLPDLASSRPGHRAIRYLCSRGFDLDELDEVWGVQVCLRPKQGWGCMRDRITIPIFLGGRLVAWQGRYPGERDWRAEGIAKYWTMPGAPKGRILYNWDRASQESLIVVVEGPTDAWRVGAAAVALLGKQLSSMQHLELVRFLRRRPERRVVVMLDPDQDRVSAAQGRPHHQSVVLHRLAAVAASQVRGLWLPPGQDPGSAGREWLWAQIRALEWPASSVSA